MPLLGLDGRWEIHCFEPNPECREREGFAALGLPVMFHAAAAWVHDGQVPFGRQDRRLCRRPPPVHGASLLDGWGSAVAEIQSQAPGLLEPVDVPCVDFSRLLAERRPDDDVVVKMDVEGAEFPILRRLTDRGTIRRIRRLYIEWHDWLLETESPATRDDLEQQVRRAGVEVIRWT